MELLQIPNTITWDGVHNMIIKSEEDEPVDNNHPFDYQVPLAQLDQVPGEFATFPAMHQEICDLPKFKLNCIMIWFSTCGGGEKTKHNS
jgi:hypothetical protein